MIEKHTAGDPQTGARWTNLTERELADLVADAGSKACRCVHRRLVRAAGYVRRKALKKRSLKKHPDRDRQYQKIQRLTDRYRRRGQPVISIDTKKKELIGNFYRDGKLYTSGTVETLDHDFPSDSDGKIVPHGIFDVARNTGHIHLGLSRDTTEFAVESLRRWWDAQGKAAYPKARRLLVLCDGGGSNPANSRLFKQDLGRLADATGLKIRIAHFAPYCSKHNPIEHRMFCHVTRACQGVIFRSVELVKELIERTRTAMGLRVSCEVLAGQFATGRKADPDLFADVRLRADAILPKFNYRILPRIKSSSY